MINKQIVASGLNRALFCTGCGACATICPRKAITIELNSNGFYSARLNENLCIGCGLCKNVCILDAHKDEFTDLNKCKMITCKSKDVDLYEFSSSGAFASTIYKYAFDIGWKFIGVEYDSKSNITKYNIGNTVDDIFKFAGSKYLQPFYDDIINKAIKSDFNYVVIGLPCHIYGFKKIVEKKKLSDKFIFVDLCCHGTISYLFWKSFCKENFQDEKITAISFRSHKDKPSRYTLNISTNSKCYKKTRNKSEFYKAFDDSYLIT